MSNHPKRSQQHQSSNPPKTIITATQETYHSGPLPPASEIEAYENALPGLAKEIVEMAKAEQKARHSLQEEALGIERYRIRCNARQNQRGQWLGAGLSLCVLGVAGWLIYLDKTEAAVDICKYSLIGIASIFVMGKIANIFTKKDQ